MKTFQNKLTITIVNYNAGSYLLRCLESIKKLTDEAQISIIVVDNASSDDSINKARKVNLSIKFILNQDNIGFGKAQNIALKQCITEYVLILNPDTVLEKGTISKMLQFMVANSDVGAATCKILLGNGEVDLTAHRGFPTPLASFLYFLGNDSLYHLSKKDLESVHEVDAISGAFFLTRKSILEQVNYFDEDYFMYAEDIDLCFKIKALGYKVIYNPVVKVFHYKGVSSGLKKHSQDISTANLSTKIRSLDAFYDAMGIFYKKHYEKNYPFFINSLIYFAIGFKWWLAKRKLTV